MNKNNVNDRSQQRDHGFHNDILLFEELEVEREKRESKNHANVTKKREKHPQGRGINKIILKVMKGRKNSVKKTPEPILSCQ